MEVLSRRSIAFFFPSVLISACGLIYIRGGGEGGGVEGDGGWQCRFWKLPFLLSQWASGYRIAAEGVGKWGVISFRVRKMEMIHGDVRRSSNWSSENDVGNFFSSSVFRVC